MIDYSISPELLKKEIDLHLLVWEISRFKWKLKKYDSSGLTTEIIREIKSKFTLDSLKQDPLIAKFRAFYWKHLKVDPTKIRPASEALIRRILHEKPIPKINPLVDAYNWGSIRALIPMGAYDLNQIHEPFNIRFARQLESFLPIGKKEELHLSPQVLVNVDASERIMCQYPYRDAHFSRITSKSNRILIIAYGCPNISKKSLTTSLEYTKANLNWFKNQDIIEYESNPFQYISNHESSS